MTELWHIITTGKIECNLKKKVVTPLFNVNNFCFFSNLSENNCCHIEGNHLVAMRARFQVDRMNSFHAILFADFFFKFKVLAMGDRNVSLFYYRTTADVQMDETSISSFYPLQYATVYIEKIISKAECS